MTLNLIVAIFNIQLATVSYNQFSIDRIYFVHFRLIIQTSLTNLIRLFLSQFSILMATSDRW